MTEQTVAWRWARSVLASDCALAMELATTLWEEPVSTTKSRRRPPANRTATPSEMSPGTGVTVRGTVVPVPPVSATGGGPVGPVYGLVPSRGAPFRAREDQRARGEVDADCPEARQDVGTQQSFRLTLSAHLGQRRRRQLLRRQVHSVERPGTRRHGLGRAGAPDAGELGRSRRPRPSGADGRVRRRWWTAPHPSRGRRERAPCRRCRHSATRPPGPPRCSRSGAPSPARSGARSTPCSRPRPAGARRWPAVLRVPVPDPARSRQRRVRAPAR